VYRIPLDLFPGLTGFAHLVAAPGLTALIDVGSGFGDSNEQLEAGLESVARDHGEAVSWDRLSHVVISHGHIDHYGGLTFVRRRTTAPVVVHRLDRRLLTRFEASLEAMAGRMRRFLHRCGVDEAERGELMGLYLLAKSLFSSQEVDVSLRDGRGELGPIGWLHVPGHCPGQLVLRLGGLLLTSDHVLPGVTPHMAPGWLAKHTGLATYLDSLDRLAAWTDASGPGLGGHGPAIENVGRRILEIKNHHERRLALVREALLEPHTIADLARRLFPDAGGYHRLLALEEVAAHVEFLESRGEIVAERRRREGVGWQLARPDEPLVRHAAAGFLPWRP
jgi:glyoxylase-like metal-dependent hydrolase (beta-lactamase superfamily II)